MCDKPLQSGAKADNKHSASNNEDLGPLDKFAPELGAYIRRCKILLSCWTIPFEKSDVQTFNEDDGVSARAFALIIIAALIFAARGVENHDEAYTAFASGLAIALTIALNLISHALHITVRDKLVVSAYASTIIVMFLFVVIPQVLFRISPVLYLDLGDIGVTLVSAVVAGVLTFVLLLLKSKLWNRRKVGRIGILDAAILTGGSTVIAIVIALMSPGLFDKFDQLLEKISKFFS
jgi:hypothetical protein